MPRSLVQIQNNKIVLPEEYNVFIVNDLLVITKPFSYQYAIINLKEMKVIQNTIQRKSIVPSILIALSWTPETNTNNEKSKSKKAKKNEAREPPKITMINFVKKKTVVVQNPQTQQSQNQQQS